MGSGSKVILDLKYTCLRETVSGAGSWLWFSIYFRLQRWRWNVGPRLPQCSCCFPKIYQSIIYGRSYASHISLLNTGSVEQRESPLINTYCTKLLIFVYIVIRYTLWIVCLLYQREKKGYQYINYYLVGFLLRWARKRGISWLGRDQTTNAR